MQVYQLPDTTQVLPTDQFQIGNQKYPAGWLLHVSPQAIAAAGITGPITIADPVVTAQVPPAVTNAQFRIALLNAGLLTAVQTRVNQASNAAQNYWNNAPEFRRDSAAINALATAVGITSDQMDQLFVTAGSIFP